MSEPTEKDRETARACLMFLHDPGLRAPNYAAAESAFAQALADARADRQAEDAKIARRGTCCCENGGMLLPGSGGQRAHYTNCAQGIARDILAPSSGPTYEQRIRAEIAEAVGALETSTRETGEYLDRDDVLATIQRSEK